MSKVLYKVEENIAYVAINRPDVLNCFDYETLQQLSEVVNLIEMDPEVRVAIFTGAGEKAFSAGADLKERKTLSEKEVRRNVKAIRDVFNSTSNASTTYHCSYQWICIWRWVRTSTCM